MVRARCRWGLLAIALAASWPGYARADRRVWTVEAGDVLSVLATRFGVTVEQLRSWNALDGDRILVGQELVVGVDGSEANPASAEDPAAEEGTRDADHEEESADAALAPTTPLERLPTYRIRDGDTLSRVAHRFGVELDALLAVNPEIDPDRIRSGESLRLPESRRRVEHRVRPGEVLSRLARHYEVTLRELRHWNPALRRRGPRAGETLTVYTEIPESRSESIGAPYDGSLQDAVRLPPHPGYYIRDRNRSWGTVETIRWIGGAFDAVRSRHPDAPRLRVHDISRRRGGRMTHHRSHQSGRDADISYFYTRCGDPCPMRRIGSERLDSERQWTLLERWLREEVVEAIFIDYELQAPLYEEARRRGATRDQLHRWFQYPRGRTYPLGIIRHFPKHRDHLHVRFVCPDTDESCEGR